MEIKPVRGISDIKRVVPLFVSVFAEVPYRERWSEDLARNRLLRFYACAREFCFFAVDGRRVVGLVFCTKKVWDDGVHVIIEDVAVDPDYRTKSVGSMLAGQVELEAKKQGIASIDGAINMKAKDAFDFWKKRGYLPNGYIEVSKKL